MFVRHNHGIVKLDTSAPFSEWFAPLSTELIKHLVRILSSSSVVLLMLPTTCVFFPSIKV